MKPGSRITQIMSAEGWRAVYATEGEQGAIELQTEPIVAWALVYDPREEDYPDAIEPMGDVGGYMDLVTEVSNYIGALAPGADVETYRAEAEEHVARQRRKHAKREEAA